MSQGEQMLKEPEVNPDEEDLSPEGKRSLYQAITFILSLADEFEEDITCDPENEEGQEAAPTAEVESTHSDTDTTKDEPGQMEIEEQGRKTV